MLPALMVAAVVEAQSAPPPTATALELRESTEAIGKQIEQDNRHVLHLQAVARKEKDVIKLTCINDKLVQIKAQQNLFDNAALQLESVSGENDESRHTVFLDVQKAGEEIKKLRGEADGCAGELEMYKQESRSDVERPELDDPTQGGPFELPEQSGDTEVEPPGYATPYK